MPRASCTRRPKQNLRGAFDATLLDIARNKYKQARQCHTLCHTRPVYERSRTQTISCTTAPDRSIASVNRCH